MRIGYSEAEAAMRIGYSEAEAAMRIGYSEMEAAMRMGRVAGARIGCFKNDPAARACAGLGPTPRARTEGLDESCARTRARQGPQTTTPTPPPADPPARLIDSSVNRAFSYDSLVQFLKEIA